MSISFVADESVLALVKKVMVESHPDLVKAKVDVGVTFSLSAKEGQPALSEHGQPTFGITKIVPLKDRIRKNIDVELWLDGDEWGTDKLSHRMAKVDHLLMRVEVKKPKPKKKKKSKAAQHGTDEEIQEHEEQEFLLDAGGRAVLKKRKPDLFVPGGFREVIERYGDFAPECMILDRARIVADAACKVKDEVEASDKAEVSVNPPVDVAGMVYVVDEQPPLVDSIPTSEVSLGEEQTV